MDPQPQPRKIGLSYLYEPHSGITLRLEQVRKSANGLQGAIIVDSALPGASGRIERGRVLLDGPNSRRDFIKAVAESARIDYPWADWVKTICDYVLEHHGHDPSVELSDEAPGEALGYLADPLLLAQRPNLLFGPYSSGKGQVAVALTVAIAAGLLDVSGVSVLDQGPVYYCDWESTLDTFRGRVWAVARGMGLNLPPRGIRYKRCRGPFADMVESVSAEVAEVGAKLLILDSLGLAIGAAGGERIEDGTLRLYDALSYVETTSLLIDHVSDQGGRTDLAGKAIGTQYKMAEARQAWEIRKEQLLGSAMFTVGLYHAKPPEDGPKHAPVGWKFAFGGGEVRISEAKAGEKLSLIDRLAQICAVFPHTLDELLVLFPSEDPEDPKKQSARRAVLRATLSKAKEKGLFTESDRGWLRAAEAPSDRGNGVAEDLDAIPF